MKILDIIKKNNIYILVLCLCLVIMLISTLYEANVFIVIKEYLFNPDFKNNLIMNGNKNNLMSVIIDTITTTEWTYDYLLIWGTNLFQVLLPFFAMISGILFYYKVNTIDNMKIHKERKYSNFLIKKSLILSLKMATVIFLSFGLFYLFTFIISRGKTNESIIRVLFLDILGKNFYYEHTKIYYLLEGGVRFFIMPFIYSFFACIISLEAKNFKQAIMIPIAYYFGLILISMILDYMFGGFALYINPLTIMTSSAYNYLNTIFAFLIHLFPIGISIFVIWRKAKKIEI